MKYLTHYFFITYIALLTSSILVSCDKSDPIIDDDTEDDTEIIDINPEDNVIPEGNEIKLYIGADVDDYTSLIHKTEWGVISSGSGNTWAGAEYGEISLDNNPELETVCEFVVDENNPYYATIDGVLFNKNLTVLICLPPKYLKSKYVVPESVNTIGEGAFLNNYNLKTIYLKQTGKISTQPLNIEQIAFANCKSLETVYLPKHYVIKENVFGDCKNLKIFIGSDSYDFNPTTDLYIPANIDDYKKLLHETKQVITYSGYSKHENMDGSEIIIPNNSYKTVDVDDHKIRVENILKIIVDKNNPYYTVVNGALYSKDGSKLIFKPNKFQTTTKP